MFYCLPRFSSDFCFYIGYSLCLSFQIPDCLQDNPLTPNKTHIVSFSLLFSVFSLCLFSLYLVCVLCWQFIVVRTCCSFQSLFLVLVSLPGFWLSACLINQHVLIPAQHMPRFGHVTFVEGTLLASEADMQSLPLSSSSQGILSSCKRSTLPWLSLGTKRGWFRQSLGKKNPCG